MPSICITISLLAPFLAFRNVLFSFARNRFRLAQDKAKPLQLKPRKGNPTSLPSVHAQVGLRDFCNTDVCETDVTIWEQLMLWNAASEAHFQERPAARSTETSKASSRPYDPSEVP